MFTNNVSSSKRVKWVSPSLIAVHCAFWIVDQRLLFVVLTQIYAQQTLIPRFVQLEKPAEC